MGWVLGFWEFLFPILCSYLDGEHCRLRSGNVSLDDSNRETCCISAVLVPTWGGGGLGTGARMSVLAPTPGRRPCLHMFRFSEPQGTEEKKFTSVAI